MNRTADVTLTNGTTLYNCSVGIDGVWVYVIQETGEGQEDQEWAFPASSIHELIFEGKSTWVDVSGG